MKIDNLDYFVLTVTDIATTSAFYQLALGMSEELFAGGRIALRFGHQKINLHQLGLEFEPKAHNVTAGSADLCFIMSTPIDGAISHLKSIGVTIIEGPVQKSGALGPIRSILTKI